MADRMTAQRQAPERPGTDSYWIETSASTQFSPLDHALRTDVVVVGGGIAGLTAAYFLAQAGRRVAVVDRFRVAMAETGHTTAHLTNVVDTRLRELVKVHGQPEARLSWESGLFATDLVERVAREEGIDCGFQRLDGILYGNHSEDPRVLAEEATWAERFGFSASPVDAEDLPFPCKAALGFPNQAKFHPRKYLLGLVGAMERAGVEFFEGTEATGVDTRQAMPEVATREGATIRADHILVTTNVPTLTKTRMHTTLYPYRSYVIGARVAPGTFGDVLYWSTFEPGALYGPYYYTRLEPGAGGGGKDLVILGGEDHKVGHEKRPEQAWDRLQEYLEDAAGPVEVLHKWSGQIIENIDGLPYIGVAPGGPDNVLLATAFSGNGMTFGILAGWMLAERVLGRATPYDKLYDPARKTPNLVEFVTENVDTLAGLAQHVLPTGDRDVDALAPGEGTVITKGGRKVAVHRREDGSLLAVTATCTHLGCVVKWNRAEQSWDCPCHGSRFDTEGGVINGPARDPLESVDIRDDSS